MNKDTVKRKNQSVYTQRTFLIISSLLILGVGVWLVFGVIWNQVQKSFTLKAEIKQAEIQKQTQEARLEKAKKIMEEFANQQDVKERLSLSLPSSTNYYQVINEIANNAGLSSVIIQSGSFKEKTVMSNRKIVHRNSKTKVQYIPQTSKIIKPYTIISLNLTGQGTYSQVKTFVSLLERDIRIMDIREFSMEKSGSISSPTDPIINFGLKLNFYRQER